MISFSQFFAEAFQQSRRDEGDRDSEIARAEAAAAEAAEQLKKNPHSAYWAKVKETMEARASRLRSGGSMGKQEYIPKPKKPSEAEKLPMDYTERDKKHGRRMPDPSASPPKTPAPSSNRHAVEPGEIKITHDPDAKGVRIVIRRDRAVISKGDVKTFVDVIKKIATGSTRLVASSGPLKISGNKAKARIVLTFGITSYTVPFSDGPSLSDRIAGAARGAPKTMGKRETVDPAKVLRKLATLAKKHGMSPSVFLTLIRVEAQRQHGIGSPKTTKPLDMTVFLLDRIGKEDLMAIAETIASRHHRSRK